MAVSSQVGEQRENQVQDPHKPTQHLHEIQRKVLMHLNGRGTGWISLLRLPPLWVVPVQDTACHSRVWALWGGGGGPS